MHLDWSLSQRKYLSRRVCLSLIDLVIHCLTGVLSLQVIAVLVQYRKANQKKNQSPYQKRPPHRFQN